MHGRKEVDPGTNESSPNASALSIVVQSPGRLHNEATELELLTGPENCIESVASMRPVRSKSIPNRLVLNSNAKKTYE